MRYQRPEHADITQDEYLQIEAAAHDSDYSGKYPFDLGKLEFAPADVWGQNDHAHKRGTYERGWRKRRMFQLIDLPSLEGKRVLDWGCGIGQHAALFAMYGAEVSGFDLSPVGIERAEEIAIANSVAELCDFQVANGTDLPYNDDTFDVVVCNAVIHHAIKYPGITEEVRRVLKPGGKLYVADGIRENGLYRFGRRLYHLIRPHADFGDVDLDMNDIDGFFTGYEDVQYERFSLVEKFVKRLGHTYESRLPVLALYYLAKKVDDFLFRIFPKSRTWSLELIAQGTKPGP